MHTARRGGAGTRGKYRRGVPAGVQGAPKLRETGRWLKVDPAIAGKVDLRPGVRVGATHHPVLRFGVEAARGIADHHASWYPQLARHNRHRGREVVAEALVAAAEQEPGHALLPGRESDVGSVAIVAVQVILQRQGHLVHGLRAAGDLPGEEL